MKDKFFPAPFTQAEARNSVLFFLHFLLWVSYSDIQCFSKETEELKFSIFCCFSGDLRPLCNAQVNVQFYFPWITSYKQEIQTYL